MIKNKKKVLTKKLIKLRYSDAYYFLVIILSVIFLVGSQILEELEQVKVHYYFFIAMLFFIIGLAINNIKKVRELLDYD